MQIFKCRDGLTKIMSFLIESITSLIHAFTTTMKKKYKKVKIKTIMGDQILQSFYNFSLKLPSSSQCCPFEGSTYWIFLVYLLFQCPKCWINIEIVFFPMTSNSKPSPLKTSKNKEKYWDHTCLPKNVENHIFVISVH